MISGLNVKLSKMEQYCEFTDLCNSQVLPVLAAVGTLLAVGVAVKLYLSFKDTKKKKKVLLEEPTVKYALPLVEKQIISHDTRLYRFGLPTSDHVLGLPIGQHVHLTAKVNEEVIIRAYTPVSSDDDKGHVDLVVKVRIFFNLNQSS